MAEKSKQAKRTAFAIATPLSQPLSVPLTNVLSSQRRVLRANALRKRSYAVPQRLPRLSTANPSGVPSLPEDPLQNAFVASGEAVLLDPEDREFVEWASSAENKDDVVLEKGEEEELPLESILNFGNDKGGKLVGLNDDEELELPNAFSEDDDEDGNEDEEGDEEDDDEELAARAGSDDFDDDIPVPSLSKRRNRMPAPASTPFDGVEGDDNDEVEDVEDVLEPVADDIVSIFGEDAIAEEEAAVEGVAVVGSEADSLVEAALPVGIDNEPENGPFEGTDEDIQNAADILSSSGLLGLGVESGKRDDVSAVTEFALGTPKDLVADASANDEAGEESEKVVDDTVSGDLEIEDEDEDDEDDEKSKEDEEGLESYVDGDEEDDDDFTLTTRGSFGRVWALNDDSYVTITEKGQSYAYELDEEDEADQDMSVVRRGKQGGWSGGLASYATQFPEGSREWVARRAYELVSQSSQSDMFRWTRRHQVPPPIIRDLYPESAPPPPQLPRTKLQFSTPDSVTPIIGTDSSASNYDDDDAADEGPREITLSPALGLPGHALDRSVKFPCQFKFKVEGGGGLAEGDDFERSLAADLETILKRPVTSAGFQVEPAGRYKRVVMMVNVESASQVTQVYDALRNNPAVKFSFG